ncbi:transposase [Paenibacillus sp. 1P07SE]|uniref:transposase n=1 Tax=Paenibacillus sp. 1P07SE TaxID=3132209 RepID=UPI0039A477DB
MQRASVLDSNATVYHYQLVRKIPVHQESLISYGIISLLLLGFQYAFYGQEGVMHWALGLPAVAWIQWLILRLTMYRVDEGDDRRWGWRFRLPWSGYLPIQMVELAQFRRLHRHLIWLGLCTIAIAYPWAPESLLLSLICWHVWLLAPRLVILRKLRKARRDGVLRLNEQEVLFYHR